MIHFRTINAETDKPFILELHCEIIYESETPWARKEPYTEYRKKWLSTSQPEQFFSHLIETMKDHRTIAEVIEDVNHNVLGYIWVIFQDVPDYHLTIAEIMDLIIVSAHRRAGLGTKVLKYIEDRAVRQGAHLLRSETGIENVASQNLHRKLGFETYRVLFEKQLQR
jgi:aminoglycoside 6'-N-acetyltransferase I